MHRLLSHRLLCSLLEFSGACEEKAGIPMVKVLEFTAGVGEFRKVENSTKTVAYAE